MTRFKVAIALACLGGALAGCASKGEPEAAATTEAPAAVPVSIPMVEVNADSLNVRATPDAKGAVVASLKRGERANAPQPAAGGWMYVETAAGAKGYVAAQYVKPVAAGATSAPAPAPAAAAAPTTPAPATTPAAAPPAEGAATAMEESTKKPAPGTKLARVTAGMSEAQVVEILGAPTTQQNYVTGKAWMPFYYGPDTSRLDYRYKGVGIVVFTRNRYSGTTEVIRVDSDPSEDGVP